MLKEKVAAIAIKGFLNKWSHGTEDTVSASCTSGEPWNAVA